MMGLGWFWVVLVRAQAGMKRWMAWLALSWNAALRRSGKMSAWSATGPVTALAALA